MLALAFTEHSFIVLVLLCCKCRILLLHAHVSIRQHTPAYIGIRQHLVLLRRKCHMLCIKALLKLYEGCIKALWRLY
jgi:hypothetical protein